MKKILAAFIALGLLLVPVAAVQAQLNEQYISLPFADETVSVSASDYIVIGYGWAACTPGLVRTYLSAMHHEIRVDDVVISIADGKDQYWGPITENPDANLAPCIAGNKRTGWSAHWRYPLGTLTPGEHEVYFYHWLDHPVIDGGDYDGDGKVDIFNGLIQERTITIIVSE